MKPATQDIIRRHWNELLDGTARRKDPAATKWYGVLHSAYNEAQRHYHTLDHVAAMLREYERLKHRLDNPKAFLAAIFFHDIVYRTALHEGGNSMLPVPAGQNETKSARIARMALAEMGFERSFCKNVAGMIKATADHKMPDDYDHDLALLLDADMAILGAKPESYKEYTRQIRQEYAAFDDITYHQGRLALFVRPTLAQLPIFKTKDFQSRYEQAARRNVLEEQKRITSWLAQNGADIHPALKPRG